MDRKLKTKLFIVRHGESVANRQGIYQGQTYDTDLSDLGKKQAKALAMRVKDFRIKKIISSPLKRTYQTALESSKLLGIPIETNKLIMETNHGKWEGKSKTWIVKNYPEVYETWQKNPSTAIFPEGESFLDTLKRVESFMHSNVTNDDTLLITHDNIVRIFAIMADGSKLDDIWKFEIESAAINCFEIEGFNGKSKLKALKLNDTEHLKGIRANLGKHAL